MLRVRKRPRKLKLNVNLMLNYLGSHTLGPEILQPTPSENKNPGTPKMLACLRYQENKGIWQKPNIIDQFAPSPSLQNLFPHTSKPFFRGDGFYSPSHLLSCSWPAPGWWPRLAS